MENERTALYQKTNGFIQGVCHPNDDCALIKNAGIAWVRRDIPFPFDASGAVNPSYTAYLERTRMFMRHGIRSISVTPYPDRFIRHGIDVRTAEGLEKAADVCAKIAGDYRGTGTCWQATNEMHIRHFRAPLNEAQAQAFLVACIRGIKRGDPGAAVGHNSVEEAWLDRCVAIEKQSGGCDYIGLDLYDGTWSDGGPDTFGPAIDRLAKTVGKPVILMEFGFSSLGGVMGDPREEATAFLRRHGFRDIADAESQVERLIGILPAAIAQRVRACAPEDQIRCIETSFPHILKKWSGKSDLPHTEAGQAAFFAQLLPKLLTNPNLGGAVIYCLLDSAHCFFCGEADCPCETAWGLLHQDGTPKPAYYAVQAAFSQK